jgi:polyhydroxyalkanoate synthesis regulator phasin
MERTTMRTRRTRSRLLSATVGAVVTMLFVGGVASATIPAGGLINGCYEKRTGLLRVIDAEAGKTCITKYETPISWNAELGPEVAALETALADEATARQQADQVLRANVTQLNEQAVSLQSQVNDNRGLMLANDNDLHGRITSVLAITNTGLAEKQSQINDLSRRVSALEEALAALQAEVDAAKK